MGNLHFRISYWWVVAVILSIAGWDLGTAPSAANFLQAGQHATDRNLHVVQAQIGKLIGNWQIVWTGARDTYTGVLEIVRKQDENLYVGQVTLTASKGTTVIQDVRITTSDNEIHIECSNLREPSGAKRNYNPDRFFVTLIGNRMEGYSLDTAGQRGPKIVFTRAK